MTFLAAAGTSNDHAGRTPTRDLVTELVRELREVEHWRRLVAARLDLAVAAVTSIDEPCARPLPSGVPCQRPIASDPTRSLKGVSGRRATRHPLEDPTVGP